MVAERRQQASQKIELAISPDGEDITELITVISRQSQKDLRTHGFVAGNTSQ
jgi:hypothetical protein